MSAEPKPHEVSPTGAPLIPPRFVPYLAVLVVLAAVAHEFFPEYAMVARISGAITSAATLLGIVSPGMRKGALKALAGLGLLGCLYSTTAMAAPADAPLAEPPVPSPVLAPSSEVFRPGPITCERWDRARRNWGAIGVVSGALATTGGLVSALGTVGEDKAARVSVAITSALLAGLGTLAAYQTGEYSAIYSKRCAAE